MRLCGAAKGGDGVRKFPLSYGLGQDKTIRDRNVDPILRPRPIAIPMQYVHLPSFSLMEDRVLVCGLYTLPSKHYPNESKIY